MMEKTRQGEIALELVKYVIKTQGARFMPGSGLRKELLKISNATSVTVEELRDFLNPLMVDVAKTLIDQSLDVKSEVPVEDKPQKEHVDDGHRGCHGCCHHGHDKPGGH